jgi:hypothetical protein
MNDVMAQQLAAQKKLQQRGQQVFGESLKQSTPQAAQQQIAQGSSQLLNAARQAQAVPLGLPTNATTSADQQANQARAGLDAQAMADFGGYGQFGQQQALKDREVSSQLGFLNDQSRYNASMLPGELQAAQHEYAGLQGIGSLLGTVGQLGGLAGQMGLFSAPSTAGFGQAATNSMTSPWGMFGQGEGLTSLSPYNAFWNQYQQAPLPSFGSLLQK